MLGVLSAHPGRATTRTGRFRHVVFADVLRASGRAVDFAPPPQTPAAATRPLSPEEESFLRSLLRSASLDFRAYRPETLGRRISACLRALHARSVAHARVILQHDPTLIPMAVSALIIGVTSFFRDPSVFQSLGERVLPELARPGAGLRVWSVGCSDGAELYSVAMLLDEIVAPPGGRLLGTDCRPDAIARAASGNYDAAAIKSVGPGRVARYFTSDQGRWNIDRTLRAGVRWAVADALAVDDAGEWDMILCRNFAMYLDPAAAVRLWARLEAALRPGGMLVLGKAERPIGTRRLMPLAPCIYRRI